MTTTRRNRIWRHAISDDADVRRTYPIDALERIEQLIEDGEATHTGEVCVAIEPALPVGRVWRRVPPAERALEVFGLLRVWDTEDNNGVLIYLLLAARDVEIVADRGIHRHVGDAAWQDVCSRMETAFRDGRYEEGALAGVEAISDLLARAFPRGDGANELPNRPIVI